MMNDFACNAEQEANPVFERLKLLKRWNGKKNDEVESKEKLRGFDTKPSNCKEMSNEKSTSDNEFNNDKTVSNEINTFTFKPKQKYEDYRWCEEKEDHIENKTVREIISHQTEEGEEGKDRDNNTEIASAKNEWLRKWIEENRQIKELEMLKNKNKGYIKFNDSIKKDKPLKSEEIENKDKIISNKTVIAEKLKNLFNWRIDQIETNKEISKLHRDWMNDGVENKNSKNTNFEDKMSEETQDINSKTEDSFEPEIKKDKIKECEKKSKFNEETIEDKNEGDDKKEVDGWIQSEGSDKMCIINDRANNYVNQREKDQSSKAHEHKGFISSISMHKNKKVKENNKQSNNYLNNEEKYPYLETKQLHEREEKERERALEIKREQTSDSKEQENNRVIEENTNNECWIKDNKCLCKEEETQREEQKERDEICLEEMKWQEERNKALERERLCALKIKEDLKLQSEIENQLQLHPGNKEQEERENIRHIRKLKTQRDYELKIPCSLQVEEYKRESTQSNRRSERELPQNETEYNSKLFTFRKAPLKTEIIISCPLIKKKSSQQLQSNSTWYETKLSNQNTTLSNSSVLNDTWLQQETQRTSKYNIKQDNWRNKSSEKPIIHSNTVKTFSTVRPSQMTPSFYRNQIPYNTSSNYMEPRRSFNETNQKLNPSINNPHCQTTKTYRNQINQSTQIYSKTPICYTKASQSSSNQINTNKDSQQHSSHPNSSAFKDPYFQLNLEDLMIWEEKLSEILTSINSGKLFSNECFEWWNYFFHCSLFRQIEKVFHDLSFQDTIQLSIKYELLSILICYNTSFDQGWLGKVIPMLKTIMNSNHDNFIIICEYILSKISTKDRGNSWVYKLNSIVQTNKNKSTHSYADSQKNANLALTSINKIKSNTNSINNDLRIILKNYPNNEITEKLISLFKSINTKSYEDINNFFLNTIIRVSNPNASVLASVVLRKQTQLEMVVPPYIKTKNLKEFTLVLDLDETIFHFKSDWNNPDEGILIERPGWIDFLESVGNYYEIIAFTAGTQVYADALIDVWEENQIYFDYRLYRQHTIILQNDFVKDWSRIGRPLDKIVIVDNMPQNFRLQRENGIYIKTYWGDDPNDTAWIELKKIWINISKEGGDIRESLSKYKDDIVKKVTSNLSKHQSWEYQ